MSSATFRLKGRGLLDRFKVTRYAVARDGGLAYTTVDRAVRDPEKEPTLKTVASMLVGMGLSKEEILKMPLGDAFDLVITNE